MAIRRAHSKVESDGDQGTNDGDEGDPDGDSDDLGRRSQTANQTALRRWSRVILMAMKTVTLDGDSCGDPDGAMMVNPMATTVIRRG
jgi:hypothetical protein